MNGERVARCPCGELRLVLSGEPVSVYACACLECQRCTGSAFAYRAKYLRSSLLHDDGPRRTWRRSSDAGRWVEQTFCPTCGGVVFMTAEALPDHLVVSAGCFSDPGFGPPSALYGQARMHGWRQLGDHATARGLSEDPT